MTAISAYKTLMQTMVIVESTHMHNNRNQFHIHIIVMVSAKQKLIQIHPHTQTYMYALECSYRLNEQTERLNEWMNARNKMFSHKC